MKRLLIAGALIITSFSSSADLVTAGGITWDDTPTGVGLGGVGAQVNFQQWFTGTATTTDDNGTVGTADDYQRITSDAAVDLNALPPVDIFGKELVGLGEFYNFDDGRGPAGTDSFCAAVGCELTFAFGGLVISGFNGTTPLFDTSAAWFNVYVQNLIPDGVANFDGDDEDIDPGPGVIYLPDVNLGDDAHEKYSEAQDGTLWAAFGFDSFVLDGTILGGVSQATLSIREDVGLGIAEVQSQLNYQEFLSDIAFTATAAFNNTASPYSTLGNGQMLNVIPEPASIAIFGLGLLGLAGIKRRKQS